MAIFRSRRRAGRGDRRRDGRRSRTTMRRTVVVAMSSPRIRTWRRRPQSVRIFRGDDLRSSDADDHQSRFLDGRGPPQCHLPIR